MPHNDRSPEISNKPNAKAWLEGHPTAAQVFKEVLQTLLGFYEGSNHGYVDIRGRAEYRFNYNNPPSEILVKVLGQVQCTSVLIRETSDEPRYKEISIHQGDSIEPLLKILSKSQYRSAKFNVSKAHASKTDAQISIDFERQVSDATRDKKARDERLKTASKDSSIEWVTIKRRVRNPDVVSKRLELAEAGGNKCDKCGNLAPFNKKSDGEPYLEVHHIKPLSEDGKDSIENTEALCPNCHRERHFGKNSRHESTLI